LLIPAPNHEEGSVATKQKKKKKHQSNREQLAMASKISLKLLVDNNTKKVLFAEAGKEFVDFVFSLLTLPIGAVVKLISAGTMEGSIGRLYQSVDHMGASYLLPGADKKDLLQPKVLQPDGRELLLLQGAAAGAGDNSDPPLVRLKLYTCMCFCVFVTTEAGAPCPQCEKPMSKEMPYVLSSSTPRAAAGGGLAGALAAEDSGGYVKGVVTYMVTDGLEDANVGHLQHHAHQQVWAFGVGKDVDLAEKLVTFGMDEVLALDTLPPFRQSLIDPS
jgi:hypothetical protein